MSLRHRFLAAVLLLASAPGIRAAGLLGPDKPGVSAAGLVPPGEKGVVRVRAASIAPEALSPAALAKGKPVELNLFPDAVFVFRPDRSVERSPSSRTLSGPVEGMPFASAALSVHDGAIAARIDLPGAAFYEITSLPGGGAAVVQWDPASLGTGPDCAAPPSGTPGGAPRAKTAGGVPAPKEALPGNGDDGTVHDVLVLYTGALLNSYGGLAGLTAALNLAIDWSNDAYERSRVPLTLRLVHAARTFYAETGDKVLDLQRLIAADDGFLDEAFTLRDAHSADTVCFISNVNFGGVAELGSFNAVVGKLTVPRIFTHELGHNQGCCHARGNGGGCDSGGVYSYSNGHQFTGAGGTYWGTIMAYDGTTIQNFSNPDVLHDGRPTGVPVGQPDEANNALTIVNFMPELANWRPSPESSLFIVDRPGAVEMEGPAGGPFAPADPVTYTVENRSASTLAWTASSDQPWIVLTGAGGDLPAGGSVPVTASLDPAAAAALPAGTHVATVKFSSPLPGVSRKRVFRLFIGQTPVVFADAGLEAKVREAISRPSAAIYASHLESLTDLEAPESNIASLEGLQHCVSLRYLDLTGNAVASLAPLAGLTSLSELWIGDNRAADLGPLAGLRNLGVLIAAGNGVEDLTPLAGLRSLSWLDVSRNAVASLTPVSALSNLGLLDITENGIRDLAPISGLQGLILLNAGSNEIPSLAPLAGLPYLSFLDVSHNANPPLAPLAGLGFLSNLNIAGNGVRDLTPLSGLTGLLILEAGNNEIASLAPVAGMTDLLLLRVADNAVSNLDPLAGLTSLGFLDLRNNQAVTLDPLLRNAGFSDGDFLDVTGNPLTCAAVETEVPALAARGVQVISDGGACATPTPTPCPGQEAFTPSQRVARALLGVDPCEAALDLSGDGRVDTADLIAALLAAP